MKKASKIEEQILKLKQRNVIITDEEKAKEVLLDIGYYRLGFYFFPFELSYPRLKHRNHQMKSGTSFSDAIALYYFDFDVRNILMRYISRIEVSFRTYTTYYLSNKYIDNPYWFIDTNIVESDFANSFESTCYNSIRKNDAINRHHNKYKQDKFAPAWKTMEFMTLGNMLALYKNIKSIDDKRHISKYFGINQTAVFENYIETIRCIRNICAHGSVLFDARLYHRVMRGPAGNFSQKENSRIGSAIKVIAYILGTISSNRRNEMIIALNTSYMKAVKKNPKLKDIIEKASQMKWDLPNISQMEKEMLNK